MPVTIESPVHLGRARFHGTCEIGAFTYFNGPANVFQATIGRYCSIAPDVVIGCLTTLAPIPFFAAAAENDSRHPRLIKCFVTKSVVHQSIINEQPLDPMSG